MERDCGVREGDSGGRRERGRMKVIVEGGR